MELFSWAAAEKAQELGATVIASESLWRDIGKSKLKKLKERKIEYLAVFIQAVDKQKEHFKYF